MRNFEATGTSRPDVPILPAARVRKFMQTYSRTASLHEAAKAAGTSVATHYRLLEASDSYRQCFAAAQQQLVDFLETEAFRRALAGSDELLIFLLRAWLPIRYGEQFAASIALSESEASAARETLARVIPVRQERVQ